MTITGANGLETFYRSISSGGNNNWKFSDVINASKMRIWSNVVGQTATTSALGANALSGITGVVSIDDILVLHADQMVAIGNVIEGEGPRSIAGN